MQRPKPPHHPGAALRLSNRAQVTQQQRDHAKRLAYGLLYGMGPTALAADLGTDVATAASFSDEFRRSLPGVDAWLGKVGACCCAGPAPAAVCCWPSHTARKFRAALQGSGPAASRRPLAQESDANGTPMHCCRQRRPCFCTRPPAWPARPTHPRLDRRWWRTAGATRT